MAWLHDRSGTWEARWKVNGKRFQKSTGIKVAGQSGMTPKQAKKLAQQAADSMELAAKGETPLAVAVDAVRAVADAQGIGGKTPAVREYLRDFQGQASAKTESNRRRAFNMFLDYLGERADMRLDMLTKDIMRDFIRYALTQVRPGTVRLYRANLAAAFNRALDDDLIARSPMPRVDLEKEAAAVNQELGRDKTTRLPFTPAELNTIFNRFPAPWCDLAQVSFWTGGQRLGDVCCLRWDGVDFKEGVVTLNTQKTGREINAVINQPLRAVLERQLEAQGGCEEYVFPDMARRFQRGDSSISTQFTALLKAWGIVKPASGNAALKGNRHHVSEKSFHSFRHSFVSMARTHGNPDIVRDMVGHDSEEVERGYFHASRIDKMRVLEATENALRSNSGTPCLSPYPATA